VSAEDIKEDLIIKINQLPLIIATIIIVLKVNDIKVKAANLLRALINDDYCYAIEQPT